MATRQRRDPLSAHAIVAAAIAIADERGVDALSMRALADDLDFRVMALYNHVANKDELLGLMVDAVSAKIEIPAEETKPLVAVRSIAVSMREAFVRHPWAAELWLRHLPGPARSAVMEALLRLLYSSELSGEIAHHGFHAVNNHVIGYMLQEIGMAIAIDDPMQVAQEYVASLPPDEFPNMIAHVHEHLEGHTSSSFEIVLDLILDGLVRLDAGVS